MTSPTISQTTDTPTVTSRALVEAIISTDKGGLARGRLKWMASQKVPAAVREYLQELDAALDRPNFPRYQHPVDSVRPVLNRQPLTVGEVAWLSSLPTDPEQVSYKAACQLAQLAARVASSMSIPASDRQLVADRWEPVQDAYDRREAEHLKARQYPTLPDPTVALAHLIAAETDELSDSERTFRARELVDTINKKMTENRQQNYDVAQRILDDVDQRVADRTSTTATTTQGDD